jgi:hypothetical protein
MGWRPARLAGVALVAVALVIAVGYGVLPLAIDAAGGAIDLTLNAGLWIATQAGSGADLSTILTAIVREAFRSLASSRVLGVIAALVLLSAGALYGLQRVLGLDEESHAN